ncbi:MAG: hypothetical protein EZS26_003610, partial [Candidatus Ordinivivax streblomastigis]
MDNTPCFNGLAIYFSQQFIRIDPMNQ